ncbi:ATP-binding protein [Streptomyces sp. NPDC052036]|uniref:ATP-binding protein n=1 Tax=Streptomyces sp. NPDC052036 TaxID=3155171 RepID=UPI00343C4A1B
MKGTDDVTRLLARTRSLGPSQVASWRLPVDPAVVSGARALATAQLDQWGLEHLAGSTELIVSEPVTNAMCHGDGTIGLRLIRHEALTCEVSDAGHSHPRLRHPRTTDENGRGLLLLSQLFLLGPRRGSAAATQRAWTAVQRRFRTLRASRGEPSYAMARKARSRPCSHGSSSPCGYRDSDSSWAWPPRWSWATRPRCTAR